MGLTVYTCTNHDQALSVLKKLPLDKDWTVLVKGSRGMQMEKIAHPLIKEEGVGG